MTEKRVFEVTWQSLWRIFIFIAAIAVFYLAREALSVLLVAVVLSLGIDPIISFLEEKKIGRLWGTLMVFLCGLLLVSIAIYFIFPIVAVELGGFLIHFNKALSSILGFGISPSLIKDFSLSLDKALGILTAVNVSIAGAISGVVTKIILVLSTIIITFYLSVEKDGTERLFRVILPDVYEKPVLAVFTRFKIKIRRWFATQLALSLLIGAVVSLGLWLLGVRYALILGLIAAILEVVPIIGPVLAGAIMFLVAVSESVSLGLYTLLFAFIVQQLENHVLIPVIMGRAMKIHPVIVVVSLLAGAQVAGLIGVVLAVPIAVMAQEIFNYLAERKSHRTPLGI